MSEVIIMRGLSGSGKTTVVKEYFPNHIHLSADKVFQEELGVDFQVNRLSEVHHKVLLQYLDALNYNQDIVIDNTNVRFWAFLHYAKLGLLLGRNVLLVDMKMRHPEECASRHNFKIDIPRMRRIAASYQDLERAPDSAEDYSPFDVYVVNQGDVEEMERRFFGE